MMKMMFGFFEDASPIIRCKVLEHPGIAIAAITVPVVLIKFRRFTPLEIFAFCPDKN